MSEPDAKSSLSLSPATQRTERRSVAAETLGREAGGSLLAALLWGLLWALLGGLLLYLLAPTMQASRTIELRASLAVLDHGGPALLGFQPTTHAPYAIGYSDDQGIYVIVPLLSHWLGQSDPVAVLRWLWLVAWTTTLLFSAAVFRSLFRSRAATLLAPPTLLVCILSFGFGDIYWVTAWIVVAFMPVLLMLWRNEGRSRWPALVSIALLAGVVSAIRSDAGLAVALAAAAVAAVAGGPRWLRMATVATIALAYLSPTWIVLPAIRSHRDHRIGIDLSASTPSSHPLWHSLYIGLGYTSNRYGIHYLDGYAAAAAQEADPGVAYLSAPYASALHRQVDTLVTHDPWFVARAEAQKVVVELSHAGRYILLLALLLGAALGGRGLARLRPAELALFLPALAIGALPAIVAIPLRTYELTLLAPLGSLGLLAIGASAARVEQAWPETQLKRGWTGQMRGALGWPSGLWPTRPTILAVLVAIAILAPVFLFARHLEAEHENWDRSERNPPRVVLAFNGEDTRYVHGPAS